MKKTYWDDPSYFDKRRENIYKDKISGMSNAELVAKYGVSQNRIFQIVKKVQTSRMFKGVK